MPGRLGKVTARKVQARQTSPEIPSPVKPVEATIVDDVENQMPNDETEPNPQSPPAECRENKTDLHPMALLFANGQPLLTNFEEKYLVDLILKTPNKDIEVILQEKIPLILQMNYGTQSTLFTLNAQWIFDFLLKHFQTLIEHNNSRDVCDKFLKKNVDRNNPTIAFKHWQLQTLANEHAKKQAAHPPKRRMTVRHIDLN